MIYMSNNKNCLVPVNASFVKAKCPKTIKMLYACQAAYLTFYLLSMSDSRSEKMNAKPKTIFSESNYVNVKLQRTNDFLGRRTNDEYGEDLCVVKD